VKRRNKNDEDGPRIHRTELKDTFRKHRKTIYQLVETDDDIFDGVVEPNIWDDEDASPLYP